ncbi:MAG: hypothetical protein ACD_75C02623G0004 [uncultured bacterium]|nr:MAG: hypothetical protein ACD_75C02623G0004 [uncultured bacterium]
MKEIKTIQQDSQALIDLVEKRRCNEFPLKIDKNFTSEPQRGVALDRDDLDIQFMKTFGTVHKEARELLHFQALRTDAELRDENSVMISNRMTPLLHAIGPKDELEGMLAVQMVGAHNLAMTFLARAAQSGQMAAIDANINRATKLSRTFAVLLEGLNKHRGKGAQKIVVEHVHVESGGQAIVGNVNQGEGRD